MFDLDLSKMVLFGGVALVAIGPKDLPAALRFAGRAVTQFRRLQNEIRTTANSFMAETSLDREFSALADAARVNLALNPATAMRGSLSAAGPIVAEADLVEYCTPEMQAYLAPSPEATVPLAPTSEATLEAQECVSPPS